MTKYKNKKVTFDGEVFDSKKEASRFIELRLLERAGKIQELRRQVEFELIPSQKLNGKTIERKCSYRADFVYLETEKPLSKTQRAFAQKNISSKEN